MRRVAAYAVLLLLALHPHHALGQSPERPGSASSLPASLDALYPPKAEGPVWLLAMHGMNLPLAGIVVDLNEGDKDGMTADYERFKAEYETTAGLVPEWRDQFDMEPILALGDALKGGDAGTIMAAVEKVGATCHHCHLATMVPVQQKYHWPDFKMISAHDPLSGRDLDFVGLMQMLNGTFSGIAVDLQQGQIENARRQGQAFAALFASMKETCEACHDAERAYYVDARVQSMVDDLGAALSEAEVDPAVVADLSRKIGAENCTACHLVHLPAAYSAHRPR